jgi:hypothetical protein
MKEEVINNLPEVFKEHISTLKKTSTDETNRQIMCDSEVKIINFDKIPNEYARGKGMRFVPKSNDALYIDEDNKWSFIEFKNGTVNKAEVYRKIYDSLIMMMEMKLISDLEFARTNIEYILVYNQDKYPKVQKSEARDVNYSYLLGLAKQEEILFEMEKFEGYLFQRVHTYTKELFQEKFVRLKT